MSGAVRDSANRNGAGAKGLRANGAGIGAGMSGAEVSA